MSIFESPVTKAKKGHLSNLVLLGLADGALDPRELELIVTIGLHIGLSETEVRQILGDPSKHALKIPTSEKLRLTLLYDYVLVMLVDGKVEPTEKDFCRKMARSLGFDPDEVIPKIIADLAKSPAKPGTPPPPLPTGSQNSGTSSPGITIDSDAFLSDRNDASPSRHGNANPTPTGTRIRIREVPSKSDEIRVDDFAVCIPEGEKTSDDYFLLTHNQHYSVCLRNYSIRKCDADIEIDGKDMGTFRIPPNSSATFDRPAHDDGRFTFYELMSKEGNSVGLKANQNLGLVSVTFRPEHFEEKFCLRMGVPRSDHESDDGDPQHGKDSSKIFAAIPRAGGTALTGKSEQRLNDAEQIKHDPHATVIIHLRLGARVVSHPSEPRPLTSHPRSNKIPPPLS